VQLSAIKTIEKYAESYIIKTDTQKLRIDTSIITADSLRELNAALEKLILNVTKSTGIKTAYS
jgi:molybdopterin-binding protein